MSRTIRNSSIDNRDGAKGRRGRRREREISVRAVRRRDPDLRRMGRALIALALAEAEADAAATQRATKGQTENETSPPDEDPTP